MDIYERCLLNENVSIDWKCAYWIKTCLLTENVSVEWKCVCWMKMCLLTKKCIFNENVPIEGGHNPLVINSGSYSFGNFFSISFLSSFLKIQKICGF